MNDDKYDSIMPPGGPVVDPHMWGKELVKSVQENHSLLDSLKYGPGIITGGVAPRRRVGKSTGPFPSSGVSGMFVSKDPLAEIDGLASLEYQPYQDKLRELCFRSLLICLPHGYGFFPVLPSNRTSNCNLAFGRLGYDKYVEVMVEPTDDRISHEFKLLYHIKNGKTYSHHEIRLFALDIVNTINDLNGIDDSEQDDKGSDKI